MIKGFITNLGKYNEGELIGEWITFPIDEDDLQEVFKRIGISDEPNEDGIYYEEYFFTDWECEFKTNFGEYININEVNELAADLENEDPEIVAAIIEASGCDLQDAIGRSEVIFYKGQTLVDVAMEIVEECYDLPQFSLDYFDYNAFARDLGFDGYAEVENGVIYLG